MKTYYFETKTRQGQADFESNEQAINAWSSRPGLLVIYTETDKGDFDIIWERT